jgi:hypothetical protein
MSESSSIAHVSETRGSTPDPDSAGVSSDAIWAYTILRVSFGANIMLHGVSRLLMGHAAFLAYLIHYFEKTTVIPTSLLPVFGIDCRCPGDHMLGHRHQSCAGLARVWTAANLRLLLLLPSQASRGKSIFG